MSEQTNEPMALDDVEEVAIASSAKDNDGVPYCTVHHCRMKLTSGAAKTRGKDYYKCPVPKCDETGIKVRTPIETIVPPSPHKCPRCSSDKKPVYLERDKSRSTVTGIVLVCPECGYRGPMLASPQLEAARLTHGVRRQPENIGDR